MNDDGVGYFLVSVFLTLLGVLAVVLVAGIVAMLGDGIGLWDLPDDTTCEAGR